MTKDILMTAFKSEEKHDYAVLPFCLKALKALEMSQYSHH